MIVRYGDHRPAYALEFLSADFDGGARLLVEDVPVAQGSTEKCVHALSQLIDPYAYPFTIKKADGTSRLVAVRTAAERAAGESSIIRGQ